MAPAAMVAARSKRAMIIVSNSLSIFLGLEMLAVDPALAPVNSAFIAAPFSSILLRPAPQADSALKDVYPRNKLEQNGHSSIHTASFARSAALWPPDASRQPKET